MLSKIHGCSSNPGLVLLETLPGRIPSFGFVTVTWLSVPKDRLAEELSR